MDQAMTFGSDKENGFKTGMFLFVPGCSLSHLAPSHVKSKIVACSQLVPDKNL